jgi:predicted ester cyclase
LTFEVHDVLADGDRMAARWTMHGKHTGDFYGRPGSGAAIEQRGTVFYRVADDRIAEQWVLVDVAGMVGQIESAA